MTWPFTQSLDPEFNAHTVIVELWTVNASMVEGEAGLKATVAVVDGGGGSWSQVVPESSTTANRLEPDGAVEMTKRPLPLAGPNGHEVLFRSQGERR